MAKNSSGLHKDRGEPSIPRSAVQRLLKSVIEIGNGPSNLAERRRAFLRVLTEVLDADAAQWSWGRGTLDAKTVIPIATIDTGLNHAQRTHIAAWTLDPNADRLFHTRVEARRRKHDRVTSRRQDIFPNHEWQARPLMRQCFHRAGLDCWLHSIRYSAAETWSTVWFCRKIDRKPFDPLDAEFVDLVMASVTWLHSTDDELQPSETLVGLKPRQRMVMQMLLDGLTRKTIAGQLGITEDTVGDHVKAIYRHFRVGSATELAALFLRAK